MKINKLLKYIALTGVIAIVAAACTEEKVGPILPRPSEWAAPVIKNAATNTSVEFTPETAADKFETFEWEKANYGVNVSTKYIVEIDDNEDFSSAVTLVETAEQQVDVSVEQMNNAMLALGLPGFEESTVFVRVKSVMSDFNVARDTTYQNEPLVSSVISRTAITYQSSECGNFCTIGLIGSATPGGWDTDTDLRLLDPADKYTWTTTIYLVGGQHVKFRASDSWDTNWGSNTFPEGTGTAGGPDIQIPTSGYYKVVFNDNTGDYTFTALTTPEYATLGVIGDATPGGWGADTDLTKDAGNPHIWTGTITLTAGKIKFRANDGWDVNWGGATFPSGVGVGGGADITVAPGTYAVRFNDATGEYMLMPQVSANAYTTVGIIGTATDGGWDSDTDLIKNPSNPYLFSKTITIKDGEGKFRANDGWDMNWGASGFPGGIAAKDGPNIPTKAGTYFITFNSGTGEYYFLK